MNKKQLICMWCGIACIVFGSLWFPIWFGSGLQIWLRRVFLIALITGGLIYTFRNKHGVQDERQKPLNLTRGYRRITLLLSIIAAFVTWLVCFLLVATIWEEERGRYNVDKKDYDEIVDFWGVWDANGWEAGKKGIIEHLLGNKDGYAFFTINGEEVILKTYEVFPGVHRDMLAMSPQSFDEKAQTAKETAIKTAAKKINNHKRWGDKSLHVMIGLSVLVGLPAGMAGFVLVWLIYFLVRWLILGFRTDTS